MNRLEIERTLTAQLSGLMDLRNALSELIDNQQEKDLEPVYQSVLKAYNLVLTAVKEIKATDK